MGEWKLCVGHSGVVIQRYTINAPRRQVLQQKWPEAGWDCNWADAGVCLRGAWHPGGRANQEAPLREHTENAGSLFVLTFRWGNTGLGKSQLRPQFQNVKTQCFIG